MTARTTQDLTRTSCQSLNDYIVAFSNHSREVFKLHQSCIYIHRRQTVDCSIAISVALNNKNLQITSRRQRMQNRCGPTNNANFCILWHGIAQIFYCCVGSNLFFTFLNCLKWVGCTNRVTAQPPQRPHSWVALHDSSHSQNDSGWLVTQATERRRGLAHQ